MRNSKSKQQRSQSGLLVKASFEIKINLKINKSLSLATTWTRWESIPIKIPYSTLSAWDQGRRVSVVKCQKNSSAHAL